MKWTFLRGIVALALSLGFIPTIARSDELADPLRTLQKVESGDTDQSATAMAWQRVADADGDQLPRILAGLDDATPLGANWVHAAVDAVAERELREGRQLPREAIEHFVLSTEHSPRARRLAYEWLTRVDPTAPDRLIPRMLHDPSVEFRREAVARLIDEAATLLADGKDDVARERYEQALSGARDLDQVQEIAAQLTLLGRQVDLAEHFGFLMHWKLIGPFDNRDRVGYAAVYPPEQEIDLSATYPGRDGDVHWVDHVTRDPQGIVDLNAVLGPADGNAKEVAGYALAEFVSDAEQEVEVRYASFNATKLWLNGKLVDEHNVYHAGSFIDQYVCRVTLRPGRNQILVKVCQNEQTESWTDRWHVQLRVCDAVGTAILSKDRQAGSSD